MELLIVGAGIVGLAHAISGIKRGWNVRIVERNPVPRGASTRNFGLIWPIGQALGASRARALRARAMWTEVSQEARFSLEPCGSMLLAYSDDAWQVLEEWTQRCDSDASFTRCTPERVAREVPQVRARGLRGGLFSESEARVDPEATSQSLIQWLRAQGAVFHMGHSIVHAEAGVATASDGGRFTFDRLVVCSGSETALLFPAAIAYAGGRTTRLQMMRTAPMPAGWRLRPALASELTIPFYASFADCPTLPALKRRLTERFPDHDAHGIHVLAVQDEQGRLVVGDSHSDASTSSFRYRSDIEALIRSYLDSFLDTGRPFAIEDRWAGCYLKPPAGQTHLHIEPTPGVAIVTGLGGAGMTLAFALAEEVLDGAEPNVRLA